MRAHRARCLLARLGHPMSWREVGALARTQQCCRHRFEVEPHTKAKHIRVLATHSLKIACVGRGRPVDMNGEDAVLIFSMMQIASLAHLRPPWKDVLKWMETVTRTVTKLNAPLLHYMRTVRNVLSVNVRSRSFVRSFLVACIPSNDEPVAFSIRVPKIDNFSVPKSRLIPSGLVVTL
jgi:hypothetical protein